MSAQFHNKDIQGGGNQGLTEKLTLPISAWFVGFIEKGDIPKREGENDVFTDLVTQKLMDAGTIELVERALLDSLLAELKLGSSELADKNTSLRLGRLLAAKILNGSIYRKAGKTMITLKVIETETSRVRVASTIAIPQGDDLFSTANKVADEITQKIKKNWSVSSL